MYQSTNFGGPLDFQQRSACKDSLSPLPGTGMLHQWEIFSCVVCIWSDGAPALVGELFQLFTAFLELAVKGVEERVGVHIHC